MSKPQSFQAPMTEEHREALSEIMEWISLLTKGNFEGNNITGDAFKVLEQWETNKRD